MSHTMNVKPRPSSTTADYTTDPPKLQKEPQHGVAGLQSSLAGQGCGIFRIPAFFGTTSSRSARMMPAYSTAYTPYQRLDSASAHQ